MKWPQVMLGDICELKYGQSLSAKNRIQGDFGVYGSNGKVDTHNEPCTDGPTIIIGRKGSFGEINYSYDSCWPIDTTYFVDRTCTDSHLPWLAYMMRHLRLNKLNKAAAVPGLNRNDAYGTKLLLPPIKEQRQIAAILDKADAVRKKRQQSLDMLDDFLRATFLDMFGDPHLNPRGWDVRELEEFSLIRSGVTKGRKLAGKETISLPYMRVANVQDGYIDVSDIKEIEIPISEVKKFSLSKGDLLLTEGGDPDKLGRGAVWNGQVNPCVHQNHIFSVSLDQNVATPEFMSAQIGSSRGKRYFLKSAKQTTGIASINKTQLRAFPAFLPPITLQQKYKEIAISVRSRKEQCEKMLSEANDLFASLSQRAFKGEL
ncbi:MAG: restriction endonuclease subunit S [Alphaproteobacteria bacterium]|nr:restriction endonuclease subunit S [Alphaproteobacteria bacterium]